MEQQAFLDKEVFKDLKNINDGIGKESVHYFSEGDFEKVLEKAQYFGLGIYTVEAWLDGEVYDSANHEKFKKKATDPKWYKRAFLTFKTRQTGLVFSATYKVSKKLLARE